MNAKRNKGALHVRSQLAGCYFNEYNDCYFHNGNSFCVALEVFGLIRTMLPPRKESIKGGNNGMDYVMTL